MTTKLKNSGRFGGSTPEQDEFLTNKVLTDNLLTVEGMDVTLAEELIRRGIPTTEKLAEQGTDDLLDIDDMDEERATNLIRNARKVWFK